ncbi:MAG: hypothetical protein H0V76_03525 [Blastocatellia bacterium]|nr:hypothetical protein [Blastocatellia bacterium]
MKIGFVGRSLLFVVVLGLIAQSVVAQRARTAAQPAAKPVIFAVINDGRTLEPIAHIEGGNLIAPVSGSDERNLITAFNKTYYAPKSSYRLIFGGADAGTVTVNSSDATADCAPNLAQATVSSTRATLKGKLMALATNHTVKGKTSGVRRLPTWPERNEIDALIRAQYEKNHVPVTKLDYHNLTALDVNGDGKAELVGSYWDESDATSRTLLFFIAERGADGKYAFGYSEFRAIKEDEVMGGDISALDGGTFHELLLDVFDYDGDGVAEIFTYVPAFEGAGFNVYKRSDAKWNKVFEGSNYHCGY